MSKAYTLWHDAPALTANTTMDGTSGTIVQLGEPVTEDVYIVRMSFRAVGENIPTVARWFINNGGPTTTAANNTFAGEVVLPATAAIDQALAYAPVDITTDLELPAKFKLLFTLGKTLANGYRVTAYGSSFYRAV